MILLSLLLILSNAGGIGGAPVIFPILMAFCGLSVKEAVPVVTILGISSSIVRFAINFKEKHPYNS